MKAFKICSAVIFSTCLFAGACNDSPKTDSGSAIDGSRASSNAPDRSGFSANLDGQEVSGGEIDDLQLQNTAFIYPSADNGKRLLFFLYSNKQDDKSYSFRFSVPDKTGPFTKKNLDEQPFDITLDFHGGDNSRYHADNVTVNIFSITGSRATGTFSGKFILSNDTPNGTKKEVTVTDGKFDVPFSTGNVKPE